MWPNILEAVKNRRRFTWILLSQNAQVTGFDGTTLQLGFLNAGARDNFASSGSEDVLQAGAGRAVQRAVEDRGDRRPVGRRPAPAGGRGSAAASRRFRRRRGAPPAVVQQARRPPPPRPAAPAAPSRSPAPGVRSRPAAAPRTPAAALRSRPPVAPEDDIPEDDDPDLDESALSGHDLIVRELGATVVEEYHERVERGAVDATRAGPRRRPRTGIPSEPASRPRRLG